MKSKIALALALSVMVTGGWAHGQFQTNPFLKPGVNPTPRPAVSPYLNLFRNGNSPSFNYQTLVRPQLMFQKEIQGLQGQIETNQDALTGLQQQAQQGTGGLPPTGQPFGFMTHSKYFMNLGGTGSGGTALGSGQIGFSPKGGVQTQPKTSSR